MIRFALPALALATIGCTQTPPPGAEVPGVECNAAKLGTLVGKTRSAAVEAEALKLSGAKTVRWLAPDSAATMDFRVDRLNLYTDASGKITRSGCG
ncbi:I78 family peptidase inhibitor [Sphingomonas sp. HF-S4]|uniref:I78 family peptidase inhibitor n=1 Tax=Sphingomonas agrestis TaxID=3080540 RepID=A0ABU3Y5U3_9SPHN|nr:I78 family peptidase inhibitor [Sphingomonas sp. HF-S4]MDV3456462.1 I78 family peptidase inhibitor [Sphingomonas sp. HF-S4]